MTSETIVVLVSAVIWWIPTFVALSDLQRRERLPRSLVWKWIGVLCVPVIGPPIYFWRGRPALDARPEAARSGRRGAGMRRPGVRR